MKRFLAALGLLSVGCDSAPSAEQMAVKSPASAQLEFTETEAACSTVCANDSGACLEVGDPQAVDTSVVRDGLRFLHASLMDPDIQTISAAELHQRFGLQEDVCNRSDTTIFALPPTDSANVSEISRIENIGDGCRLTASVDTPGGRLTSHIVVPPELEYDFLVNNSVAKLKPSTHAIPAVLIFDDKELNTDFGGRISLVEFGPDETFLRTDNGCTRLMYRDDN